MDPVKFFKDQLVTKVLLYTGSLYFFGLFALHMFGLPLFEHDIIHVYTHDRYIGLLGLTYAVLLFLVSLDLEKYKTLFYVTLTGIVVGLGVGASIFLQGGYSQTFPVEELDFDLFIMGLAFLVWCPLTAIMYKLRK
jgi:hypothetical protein